MEPFVVNAIPELLIDAETLPWIPIVEGIDFRLLFTSHETGRWTVVFRCQPGSFFPLHYHHGAGEYFVLKGRMVYRMGEAVAGTYGYEPLGVTHDHTAFPEYTELLFTNYGPVAFLDEAGKVTSVLDYKVLETLAQGARAAG
jgi:anti-sigma factor ChrR (cupin superfamily)